MVMKKNKYLFITQKRLDAIWVVDDNIKRELSKTNHNFDFLDIKEKWNKKWKVILNYILNIILILIKTFHYDKIYFTWENPYVIFVKFLYPSKKIYMCVHHVEDYWGKTQIGRLIIKSVYKIVAISYFTKKQLIEIWTRDEDIFVNYNGISDEFYPEKVEKFQDFEYILYVWTEVERKNIEILLLSMQKVISQYPHIKLLKLWPSAASEYEEKYNKQVQNLKCESNIIFKRSKFSQEELRKYYSNAICYISVSKLEWFWLTIPEALACACPVVASNIEPFKEILWESQILVEPNNIEEISQWIIQYIENKDFREKMSREWRNISKKFHWKENVNTLIQILNK